jgi:DNA-binding transcriptional MerR regulator
MEFTTFDIEKKLGIKLPSIKQWLERNLIRPSVQTAEGVGTKNLFNVDDLYRIRLFQALSGTGFTQQRASEISQDVNASSGGYLVIFLTREKTHRGVPFKIGAKKIEREIPQKLEGHSGLIVIDLDQIKAEIEAKLKE